MGPGGVAALRVWRRRLWAAVAGAGVVCLALLAYAHGSAALRARGSAAGANAGTALGGVPAPGFTLTDQFGRRVGLAQFRGRAVVLAFVDSRCTTICPLTAATLRESQLLLGRSAARVQLLAVNVNAGANSVADMRQWSARRGMLHHWLFLTGTGNALRAVWKAYGVYVQVLNGALMHDAAVYVIGPRGGERELCTTQPSPLQADILAQGRDLATAAARTLGLRLAPRQTGPVPVPAFVPYGVATGTGSFAVRALVPLVAGRPQPVRVGEGAPALVDFFSPTCEACRRELPVLAAYARASRSAALPRPVMVDLDFGGFAGLATMPRSLRAAPPFPIVLDATGSLTDTCGVTALPYLALTSAHGRILWRHAGTMALPALLQQVRRVLG